MSINLLGIHGKKRVGKNALADILVEEYGFAQLAFADPIRQMLQVLPMASEYREEKKLEVIPEYGKSFTELMQTLATGWGREEVREDLWLLVAEFRIEMLRKLGYNNIVVSDVRYENEAQMINRLGGRIIHLVGNRGVVVNSHSSEQMLPPQYLDYVLTNNGTIEDLKSEAFRLMEQLDV
jgi:dephospho-CoA kinase